MNNNAINNPTYRATCRAFDHGIYGAVERVSDHLATPHNAVRQTLWRITAKRTVLAAGATERHIPFANNDRPGVMLAGAMRGDAWFDGAAWDEAAVTRPGVQRR